MKVENQDSEVLKTLQKEREELLKRKALIEQEL